MEQVTASASLYMAQLQELLYNFRPPSLEKGAGKMFGGRVSERFEGMVPERCLEEESRKNVWRKSAGKMFGGMVPERCLEEGCRKDVWRKSAGDMFGGSCRKARLECG